MPSSSSAVADEVEYFAGLVDDLFSKLCLLLHGRAFPRRAEVHRALAKSAGPRARGANRVADASQLRPAGSRAGDPAPLALRTGDAVEKADRLLARLSKAIVQLEFEVVDRADGGRAAGVTASRRAFALDVLEYKANVVLAAAATASRRPRDAAEGDQPWSFVDPGHLDRVLCDRFDVINALPAAEAGARGAVTSAESQFDAFCDLLAQAVLAPPAPSDVASAAAEIASLRSLVLGHVSVEAHQDFICELAAAAVDALDVPRTPQASFAHQSASNVPPPAELSSKREPERPVESQRGAAKAERSPPAATGVSAATGRTPTRDADGDDAEEPRDDIPDGALVWEPDMTPHDVAVVVHRFYERFNPSKTGDVAHIVPAFDGRYPSLFDALNHKYLGIAPFNEPHAALPATVEPLEYHPEMGLDDVVADVADFYSSVAPAKVPDARAVVLRHRDRVPQLYAMLNAKYLEGFGSLTAAEQAFDAAGLAAVAPAPLSTQSSKGSDLGRSTQDGSGVMSPPHPTRNTRPPTPDGDGQNNAEGAADEEAPAASANGWCAVM